MRALPLTSIAYATIMQLPQRMDAEMLDSLQLTTQSLKRIDQIDRSGPVLRAVIETNPDAMKLAGALDAARSNKAMRGALNGLPVLLRDNSDTGDRMLIAAGPYGSPTHPRDMAQRW